MSTQQLNIRVNGVERQLQIEPNLLLVDLLRDNLQLTGTKSPMDQGQTGACTVLMNGYAVKSSMLLAIQANNSDITTVEGLSQNGVLSVVQQAFIDNHAVQCGYCTPAALVVVTELLNRNLNPTEADMREQLDGVLCRCTGYQNIVLAGLAAAQTLRGAT